MKRPLPVIQVLTLTARVLSGCRPRYPRDIGLLMALAVTLAACNAPPLYEKRAREFLAKQGVSSSVIARLEERRPPTADEAAALTQYDNIAVLHLVGNNPGTPRPLLERLSKHHNFEVRTGVAYNPTTPLDLLLPLRTPGQYTTVNEHLARNPQIPQEILWEMYRNGEAQRISLGMNPNCPREIMVEIVTSGNEGERTWLAANPNLPPELMDRLEKDPSELVRKFLAQNPTYKRRAKPSP